MKAFEFFGLDESASREDVILKYSELKSKFSMERYEIGEAGEAAAKNLDLLEVYYKELLARFSGAESRNRGDFSDIENLIKRGDLRGAQEALDAVSDRTGQWHFLQSIVYYKQNWFLESKKQLEFALNLEPDNPKYRESYEKLVNIIASNKIRPEDLRTKEQSTAGAQYGNGTASPCTGNCCCDLCLAQSCCQCMGGCC